MKKKFLSILLCLCMVMALLPTTALAGTYANDSYEFLVRVADHAFNAGATESYWTCSDNALTSTTSESAWNVKYDLTGDTPTVTLKNFNYTGDQNAIRSQGALNIVFEGTNVINNTKTSSSDAVDSFELHGIMVKGDLTITGTSGATLTVTSSNGNAIEANDFAAENDTRYDEKITINNANITATGYGLGIGSTQDLIITNSTINSTGSLYHGLQGGFYTTEAFGNNGKIEITNSTITASSTSGTALKTAPEVSGDYLWKTTGSVNDSDGWQTLSADSKPNYDTATTVLLKPGQLSVTYAYAYDASRDPAFPDSVGAEITASSFDKPLRSGSVSPNANNYTSSEGPWTLTEAGYYGEASSFSPAPNTTYLDGVVTAVADEYRLDADGKKGLMIHKLTDKDNTHVAYGVVIAVDKEEGYALFVGDLWNNSGAGYLLSNKEIPSGTDSITFNAQQTAQSKYSISLSPTTVTFADAQTGYTVPAAQPITVTNTGDDATGALAVALSGTNDDSFTLSAASITSIAAGGNNTFTVVPNAELPVGTYTATVTVSGVKVMPVTATVSFKVSNVPTSTYTVTVQNDGNGTGTADPVIAPAGTEITLSATANSGYHFKEWQVVSGGVTITDNKFTMPASDVTVKAVFEKNSGSSGVSTYPITVDSAKNGDVTSSHKTAAKGTTITLTVEPDKGYTLETITVTDKNGDELKLKEKNGKYTFTMPASKVYVEATFMEDNSMLNFFVDVFPGDYYYDAVLWAAKNGITDGVDAAHFAPNASCTRAQIVTFLWRAAGCPAPKSSTMPFTDVKAGSYYETAVLWAVENGITKGTGDTTFGPNATCSRAQIVSFLYRAASFPAVSGSAVFTDVSAGSYYANAVAWAVENGITGGTGNNAFSPNAACTRAQIMTFLYRWMVK